MFSMFASGRREGRAFAAGLWPRARIEAGILKRFSTVHGPHERDDYVLYGVVDGEVAFAIVLHHADGRAKDIDQIIFYARFEGFDADSGAAAAMNRNLHMAAVQIRDGALDMFAGLEPVGEFSEAALYAAFDAWKRDLAVVLGMLSGEASYAAAFGLDRDPQVDAFAVNRAQSGRAAELFKAFLGAGPALAICSACGGRGRVGFIARACAGCEGTGLVDSRRR